MRESWHNASRRGSPLGNPGRLRNVWISSRERCVHAQPGCPPYNGLVNNVKLVMDDGTASMDNIRQALVSIQGTASQVNKIRRDQLQENVRKWLSPPDPATNQNIIYEAYQVGTASWFFQGNVFAEWKATGPILWIHGKPGSGKSTLISSIIQDLDAKRAAGLASVVYYYFDFRDADKQNRQGLLSSLLLQLASESDPCYEILSRLYTTHARGARKPTDVALINCLEDMFEQNRQATYIVIDGIDECPNTSGFPTSREKVLEFLEGLIDLQLPHLRICIASRPEVDILDTLVPLTSLQVSLHEESGQRKDILDYITKVVRTDKYMRKWREEDKLLAIKSLAKKSDGIFRWAFCQLESLRRCFPASIRSAIYSLPKSLDETYVKTLLNIDAEKQEYAQRLFRCLTVSIRPLRVEELAEILAVDFDATAAPSFNENLRPLNSEEAVLSTCSSLVEIVNRKGSQIVQFSHFSVKEYLTSDRLAKAEEPLSCYHILPEPAHTLLAHVGLSVLLRLDDKIDRNTIEHFPFASYSARHWVDHAKFRNVSSHIEGAMERLFDPGTPHLSVWVWLYDIDHYWVDPMSEIHPTRPEAESLYYASLCGFWDLVKHLLVSHSPDINNRGGSYVTPLLAATVKGHIEVASLLLQSGADPNSRGILGRAPLHWVSQYGRLEAIRTLLEHSADVDARDEDNCTPLQWASQHGHPEVVRTFIKHNTDVNARDHTNWTPLHGASQEGHLEVVQLLLSHGADLHSSDFGGWTSLQWPSQNGDLGIVRLLLEHGANVNTRDNSNWTPLHGASQQGHLEVAEVLLGRGAELKSRDDTNQTPLHLASRAGHLGVVKLLVWDNTGIDMRNNEGRTPLEEASAKEHHDVKEFLLTCRAHDQAMVDV